MNKPEEHSAERIRPTTAEQHSKHADPLMRLIIRIANRIFLRFGSFLKLQAPALWRGSVMYSG